MEEKLKHPNQELLEKIYSDLKKGDIASMLSRCDDQVTFQISGKSKIAGKFNRTNFESGIVAVQKELSSGTYQLDVHDILVSDIHATVLGTVKLTRHGKPIEMRTVHVWRIQGGKPVAWYEYPRDLYQFDQVWS